MMQQRRRMGLVLATAVLAFAKMALAAEPPAEDRRPHLVDDGAAPKPLVTISKETTYLVEPLRDDGYVDYIEALYRHVSKGVTPENNALVPMMKIFGPKCIDEEMREPFFQTLGMDPLPEEGDYLVSFFDYLEGLGLEEEMRMQIQDEEWERIGKGPWSPKECPHVARWIAENENELT